ncbi:hypothetical protein FHS18_006841 [Paenibacillus phyllosphaerae]|uniref:Uncharacterized protein n=1 Tax=Paenibacillus phyllosphaerae TaxID=274593 RepID=A0A7W5B5S5_9BACL|nr:hypothetical protein [Paenibacillus phyllosphaerae]
MDRTPDEVRVYKNTDEGSEFIVEAFVTIDNVSTWVKAHVSEKQVIDLKSQLDSLLE